MSGPPELPGLIAASVCNQSATSSGMSSRAGRRDFELRMPLLTEPPRPKGLPSVMTVSPSNKSSSAAKRTGVNLSPSFTFILRSATSVFVVPVTRSASISRPSMSLTQMRFAPLTTCSFVST